MNVLRIPVAALSGLLLCLGLFWLMQILISAGEGALSHASSEPLIEFVRLKRDSQVQPRERTLPEKPEPPKALPRPEINIPKQVRAAAPRLSFKADFDLPLALGDGPYLGEVPAFEVTGSSFVPVSRTPPRYPYNAKRRGIEGWVRVSFTVTEDGTVADAVVEDADPPGVFEKAALAAVYQWKFKPRIVDGRATRGRAEQRVEFELKR
jgi:protein TonB